jgi:lipopolysaccharide/colanic/teichoic acid biosynthesis glycosyltransferase
MAAGNKRATVGAEDFRNTGTGKQRPHADDQRVRQRSQSIGQNKAEPFRAKRLYQIGRRAQDVVFSEAALIALGPMLAVTALVIYLDDPHASPIFSQIRCGRDDKPFRMYKFRSMYADAEERLPELLERNEMDGPAFKIKDDPRITRVGHFIRKTGIDELPQLWNILKGDMSIVGPRPALPREVEQYDELQKQRLLVLPGLTCYWQIQPNRNGVGFDEWVALDLKYIQERSFLVDWKIILGTAKAVLGRQGI